MDVGTINNPLLAVACCSPTTAPISGSTWSDWRKTSDLACEPYLQEFQRPTIMKANANSDLPVQGLFWIDEVTGRW